MLVKEIVYFGQKRIMACDGNCKKAWGINNRQAVFFDENGAIVAEQRYEMREPDRKTYVSEGRLVTTGDPDQHDYDDHAYYADHELATAPEEPGTWEGGDGKPDPTDQNPEKMNKWCARECERSDMYEIGEPIELKSFDKRRFNCPESEERDKKRKLCLLAGMDPATMKWNGKDFIKI